MFDIIPVTSPLNLDCGPTCLKMLLKYYGEDVELSQLNEECHLRPGGCSAKDLMRVAREHGMNDIVTFKMDAAELVTQDRPAIIWWKFFHWCVFCGQDENGKIVIVNPDRGMYRMSKGLFTSLYSGIALFNGDPEAIPGLEG